MTRPMRRTVLSATAITAGLSILLGAQAKGRQFALDSASGLRLHNVTATPATLDGKQGLAASSASPSASSRT